MRGVGEEERKQILDKRTVYLEHLEKGTSCHKIWTALPENIDVFSRLYLVRNLIWRFNSHVLGANAARVGDEPVLRRAEAVARDVPLADFDLEVGISIAGQYFFVKELAALEREQKRFERQVLRENPHITFFAPPPLSKETFNVAVSCWEEFVERKKSLLKEALRSNVQGYKMIQKLLHSHVVLRTLNPKSQNSFLSQIHSFVTDLYSQHTSTSFVPEIHFCYQT